MFQAITSGDAEFVDVLFRAGAITKDDLEKCSQVGTSPAYLAVLNGRTQILHVLHNLGVDLSKPCDPMKHGTPIFYAVMYEKFKVIEELWKLGYDLEKACDKFNKPPLYWAHRLGKVELHHFLKDLIQKSTEEREKRQNLASIKLQAHYRGYYTRKQELLEKARAEKQDLSIENSDQVKQSAEAQANNNEGLADHTNPSREHDK
mmetsp:Transcript_18766/g.24777  ORF Transcript_18766/g.24777 Transcript_18766/m.24777 type:complete len:204 (+) Transcript_18766:201-812(+)